MAVEIRQFAGLHLDVSPHGAAPQGACQVARNVEISSKGYATGRRGFHRAESVPSRIAALDGPVLASVSDPDSGETLVITPTQTGMWEYDLGPELTQDNDGSTSEIVTGHCVARQRLYLCSNYGLTWFDEATATASPGSFPTDACVVEPQPGSGDTLVDHAPNWLPDGYYVAYRLLLERETADGFRVQSAPSPRTVIHNDSGSDAAVTLSLRYSTKFRTRPTKMLLYRSFATTAAQPSDEMFLVAEFYLDSSPGAKQFVDSVPPESLGTALYTNPYQQGIALRNAPPPSAEALFKFQGSLFAANITGPWQRRLRWIVGDSTDLSGESLGVGERSTTATTTAGSATITVADASGIEVGQDVFLSYESPGVTPLGDGVVTAVSGTSITLDGPVAESNAGGQARFLDAIEVVHDGTTYRISAASPYRSWLYANGIASPFNGNVVTPQSSPLTMRQIGSQDRPGSQPGYVDFMLDILSVRGDSAPTIQATHGSEYSPPLPDFGDSPEEITRTREPGAMDFSKPDQPEHFVEGAYRLFVGDAKRPIIAAIACAEVAYIFKEDGIHTLSGAGVSSFRLDTLDTTYRLMGRWFCCEVNGGAAAWTNRGLVMISPSGQIQNLTDQRLDSLLESAVPGREYHGNLRYDARADELVFCVHREADGFGPYCFVYSTETGAWTTRTLPTGVPACSGPMPADMGGEAKVGLWDAANAPWRSPDDVDEDWQRYADTAGQTVAVSVSGGGLNGTLTTYSGQVAPPQVGDLIARAEQLARITAVTGESSPYTVEWTNLLGTLSSGSGVHWIAVDSEIKLRESVDSDIGALKRWSMALWSLDGPQRLASAALEVDSSNRAAPATVTKHTPDYALDGTQPSCVLRQHIGGGHSYASHLAAGLRIKEAGAQWRASGVVLDARRVSRSTVR